MDQFLRPQPIIQGYSLNEFPTDISTADAETKMNKIIYNGLEITSIFVIR